MEMLFQQFSLYPAMLTSLFNLDILRERPREDFKTMETEGKKVCFLEFAIFPLYNESLGLGLILNNEQMKVFPAFMRLQKLKSGEYLLLQYIEIEDQEYRSRFNGDFRSSIGQVLREIE